MSSILAASAGRTAKWVVAAVWLLVFFGSIASNLPGKFADAENNESTSFLPGDAESTAALAATERFQGGELAPLVIVYRREGGLTASDRRRVAADRAELKALRARRPDLLRATSAFGAP
jgi:putative drug exporter of the RND superfamily